MGTFVAQNIDEAKPAVREWTSGVVCTAVLEIVGHNSALSLAYDLVCPFGVITSVGVHGARPFPLTRRNLYDKNVSLDFGRCPAGSMLPMAFDLLGQCLHLATSNGSRFLTKFSEKTRCVWKCWWGNVSC